MVLGAPAPAAIAIWPIRFGETDWWCAVQTAEFGRYAALRPAAVAIRVAVAGTDDAVWPGPTSEIRAWPFCLFLADADQFGPFVMIYYGTNGPGRGRSCAVDWRPDRLDPDRCRAEPSSIPRARSGWSPTLPLRQSHKRAAYAAWPSFRWWSLHAAPPPVVPVRNCRDQSRSGRATSRVKSRGAMPASPRFNERPRP